MGSVDLFTDHYRETKKRIEEKIDKLNGEMTRENGSILDPFYKSFADLNSGGKIIRGVLADIGYRIGGGKDPGYSDPLSVAFEMFQTGVLIHDDIIDHADLRRGKETIHRRYRRSLDERGIHDAAGDTPQSAAICMGDIGIVRANEILAASYADDSNCGKLISYFDKIILDTIDGEFLDVILPAEIKDPGLTVKDRQDLLSSSVWEIYRLKTAGYSVIGPIHSGMLLAGAPEEEMDQIDRYSEQLGIAFQIKDDILGIFGDEANIGKDVGSDIEEGKLTILYEYVYANDSAAREELDECYGISPVTPERIAKVKEIFRRTGALSHAEEKMDECLEEALSVLDECTFLSGEDRSLLEGLGEYLGNRTK